MRFLFLVLTLLSASSLPARASLRVDLNGPWQFQVDPEGVGVRDGWMSSPPAGLETVELPHTWNIGKHEDYEGVAWYFKSFPAISTRTGKRVELHFGATFYRARVWLNGAEVGVHEGGYDEYWFDITPRLRETNFLAVEIDNRPGENTIPGWALKFGPKPSWYEWWHYGGIVRGAWLTVSRPILIRRQQIRVSSGTASAEVADTVFLENHGEKARLKIVARAFAGDEAASAGFATRTIDAGPGARAVTLDLKISDPRLWSFDHPNLYRMTVEVQDSDGKPIDELSDAFGIRTLEIRDGRLFLNDIPVRLTGVSRHEDSPEEGLAETRGTILHDYDELKRLQVTLMRAPHYPPSQAILDYADRNGILMISDIPIWAFSEKQLSDPKVISLARQMMRETVEQSFNHPSLFAWNIANLSALDSPGGVSFAKTMTRFVRGLDPDRFVTFADDQVAGSTRTPSELSDFVMMDEFYGTWSGPTSGLAPALDRLHATYPDKMVVISMFGVPGLFAPDSAAADVMRVRTIRDHLGEFAKRPWIAGAIFWCYQDYRSHLNLRPGFTAGYVDDCLVDRNRQRRPSFQTWADANAPAHIEIGWSFDAGGGTKTATGFEATVSRRGDDEIPSYALVGYRLEWELVDRSGRLLAKGEKDLPEIGPSWNGLQRWPMPAPPDAALRVRLLRPTGFLAAEQTLASSASGK